MSGENFATQLRALRKKAGLTQEKLAECVDCSLMTIRRWEWGQRTPRMEEVARIAAALGCTESDLLNGPTDGKIKITLTWNREDVEGEIDMNGNEFDLFLGSDGTIGIKGAAKFADREALREAAGAILKQLEFGYDAQVRRGVIQDEKAG